MVGATLALVGLLVSLYLWLWKIGVLGSIVCFNDGCETVQLSQHSEAFGIPVAFFGVAGYLVLLIVSLVGLQPRWAERPEPTLAVVAGSALGVAYSAYLTYLEAAVIHAWCQWCVISAVIITAIFVTALAGLRNLRRSFRAA
jgi:uncharacterized membrane protein